MSDDTIPNRDMPNRRRNRILLLLLFAMFFGSMLVAGLLRFSGWRPSGTKNVGELLDPPGDVRTLSPRLLASVLMLPLLCILYSCVGIAGAYGVAVQWLGVDPGLFLDNIEKYMVPKDFYMGEIKAAVFGFLVAAISCQNGFFASGGAKGVGEATTRAVVQSAVAILIANYLITSWMTPM